MELSFIQSLFKHFNFTTQDWEITEQYFHIGELKAREFFLSEGKVSDRIGVVESGLLRAFCYDENGNEITTQFHIPGTLVISNTSFNQQVPSKENIKAIESSKLIIFTYKNMQELLKRIPAWQQIPLAVSEYKTGKKKNKFLSFKQCLPKKDI